MEGRYCRHCIRYIGFKPEIMRDSDYRTTGISGISCTKTWIGGLFEEMADVSNFRSIGVRLLKLHLNCGTMHMRHRHGMLMTTCAHTVNHRNN